MNNHPTVPPEKIVEKDRIEIGKIYIDEYKKKRVVCVLKGIIGVPLIYLPVFLLPFAALSAWIVYLHLRLMGAQNLKTFSDFVPDFSTYRYKIKEQITMTSWTNPFVKIRWYWLFNCALYCPYSVGVCAWHTYLVKVVENWWCPFSHEKRNTYADAPVDKSFWHIFEKEAEKLHPDDLNNPIWNEDCELRK
jgi:hypothetical protein